LKLKDKEGWDKSVEINSNNSYSKAITIYSKIWMNLMEEKIEAGAKLEDIAEETSNKADEGIGITGFMYGMSVNIISQVWEYGEQLRIWHNAKYGQPHPTGTVNPAIININIEED